MTAQKDPKVSLASQPPPGGTSCNLAMVMAKAQRPGKSSLRSLLEGSMSDDLDRTITVVDGQAIVETEEEKNPQELPTLDQQDTYSDSLTFSPGPGHLVDSGRMLMSCESSPSCDLGYGGSASSDVYVDMGPYTSMMGTGTCSNQTDPTVDDSTSVMSPTDSNMMSLNEFMPPVTSAAPAGPGCRLSANPPHVPPQTFVQSPIEMPVASPVSALPALPLPESNITNMLGHSGSRKHGHGGDLLGLEPPSKCLKTSHRSAPVSPPADSLPISIHNNGPTKSQLRSSASTGQGFKFGFQSLSERKGGSYSNSSSAQNVAVAEGGTRVQRHQRFMRTREALEDSGLLTITMRTAELIKGSKEAIKEIQKLKEDTQEFLRMVLNNKENTQIREFLLQKKREREASQT